MEPFYGSHQGFQQFMVGIKGFAGGDFLVVCVHEVGVVCGFSTSMPTKMSGLGTGSFGGKPVFSSHWMSLSFGAGIALCDET